MTSGQPVLYESSVSYYDLPSKKWKTGTFKLTIKSIHFCSNDFEKDIPLHAISALEKRQSSFIYAAIVVSVASDKHWFASFPNRDSVYNLIELFWREALLSSDHKTASPRPKSGNTNLGKELLNLLHESETTLVNAANALSDQGQQIEETQSTVEDINTDLNVAEKFIRNMSLTESLFQMASSSKSPDQQQRQKCFKVSFTFSELVNENSFWKPGTLYVTENISLIEEDKEEQFSIKYSEIISFQVLSSWKICLKYSVDEAEKICYILCPKLEKLLKFLNSLSAVNEKIYYSEDTFISSTVASTSGFCSSSLSELQTSPYRNDLVSIDEQAQESETAITDDDIQEITSMLSNLQDLASEISKEQKSQMEKIESLMSNVERTELRMKADSKKIKKIT